MSVEAISDNPAVSRDFPEEESSGFWDFLPSIFALLTTQYNMGYQLGLYIYKSGGHLINEGTIEGAYSLTWNYNSVTNRGSLSNCRGDLTTYADKITLHAGSLVEGRTVDPDARTVESDGQICLQNRHLKLICKQSLNVTSCQEIALRGVSPESPTWQVLEHVPSGCIKTITSS